MSLPSSCSAQRSERKGPRLGPFFLVALFYGAPPPETTRTNSDLPGQERAAARCQNNQPVDSPDDPIMENQPTDSEITLKQILNYLNDERIRATYGAVANVLGIVPQSVGQRLGDKTKRTSWVVNLESGLPSGYEHDQIDESLEANPTVVRDGRELATRIRRHLLRPGDTVPQIDFGPEQVEKESVTIDFESNNKFLNTIAWTALVLAIVVAGSWILT
jgi:hypothetical protein